MTFFWLWNWVQGYAQWDIGVTVYAPCSQTIEKNEMVHLMHSSVCSADACNLSSAAKVSHISGFQVAFDEKVGKKYESFQEKSKYLMTRVEF